MCTLHNRYGYALIPANSVSNRNSFCLSCTIPNNKKDTLCNALSYCWKRGQPTVMITMTFFEVFCSNFSNRQMCLCVEIYHRLSIWTHGHCLVLNGLLCLPYFWHNPDLHRIYAMSITICDRNIHSCCTWLLHRISLLGLLLLRFGFLYPFRFYLNAV